MKVYINEHHRNRLCCSLEGVKKKKNKVGKKQMNVWKRVKKHKQRQRKMQIMLDREMKRKQYDKRKEKITKGENSD